jgi:uncharacterized protein with HEPN domain
MRHEDLVRLRHMRDAAHDALSFVAGRARQDLDSDRQLAMALVKCIEIVGEAANAVSQETRDQVPMLPWADMIGMRNRLVHGYYDINYDILWGTLRQDLRPLIALLDGVLKQCPDA